MRRTHEKKLAGNQSSVRRAREPMNSDTDYPHGEQYYMLCYTFLVTKPRIHDLFVPTPWFIMWALFIVLLTQALVLAFDFYVYDIHDHPPPTFWEAMAMSRR